MISLARIAGGSQCLIGLNKRYQTEVIKPQDGKILGQFEVRIGRVV